MGPPPPQLKNSIFGPAGPRDPLRILGRIGGNRSPLFPSKSVVIGPIFGQKNGLAQKMFPVLAKIGRFWPKFAPGVVLCCTERVFPKRLCKGGRARVACASRGGVVHGFWGVVQSVARKRLLGRGIVRNITHSSEFSRTSLHARGCARLQNPLTYCK